MKEKIKSFLKSLGKVTFNLSFSTSKLLGYIIIFGGIFLSYKLKSESVWMWSILGSAALFGTKVWSDKEKKE